jgi:hypothetical protein
MNRMKLIAAAAIAAFGVAAPAGVATAGDVYLFENESVSHETELWLMPGDRIVRVTDQGDIVTERVITENLMITEGKVAAAKRTAALLAGGPQLETDLQYERNHNKRTKGKFVAPTVVFKGCTVGADEDSTFEWDVIGGQYQSLIHTVNDIRYGDGRNKRNTTVHYTTPDSALLLVYGKVNVKRPKVGPGFDAHEDWVGTYSLVGETFVCSPA